ncbi:unnamed protein product [[Candida] boidinii]|nr:unnamed protein product [[Candida] boidinii]
MGIWEYYSVSSWKPIPVTALAQHCKKLPPGHEEQEELTTLIPALNFQPNGKLVITPDLSANSTLEMELIARSCNADPIQQDKRGGPQLWMLLGPLSCLRGTTATNWKIQRAQENNSLVVIYTHLKPLFERLREKTTISQSLTTKSPISKNKLLILKIH